MQEITSPANPRVKALVALRKRRVRDAQGVTLLEGYAELALALDAGVPVHAAYWCPGLGAVDAATQQALVDRLVGQGVDVVRLGPAAFASAAYRESPDGWLAVVPLLQRPLAELVLPAQPLLLVAEGVEKPGNLGAMLRTADAAGVDAVVAASPATDWGNPNVIRASKGTVFAVDTAKATTEDCLAWLASHAVDVVVATPDGTHTYTDVDLTGPTAVVVGAEHEGVTDAWSERATTVRIPMTGRVNSLNVATSAALVLFEAVRQRTRCDTMPSLPEPQQAPSDAHSMPS